jgi:hypothetical protein
MLHALELLKLLAMHSAFKEEVSERWPNLIVLPINHAGSAVEIPGNTVARIAQN